MNVSTITPKKRGRPPLVKLTKPSRGRGRPPKVKPKFFTEDCSCSRLNLISLAISRELHVQPSSLTSQLAGAAIAYKAVTQVREKAPLSINGKTNHSNIHYSILLWDIARIIEGMGQGEASKLLKKINGYNEERAKAKRKPSTAVVDKYARAVFASLGETNASSLRRQASNALKIRKIKMI